MEVCDIEKRVIAVVSDFFWPDEVQVTGETKFAELDLDSLDKVEIVMELEEEFDVDVPYGDPRIKFDTIRDAANCFAAFAPSDFAER